MAQHPGLPDRQMWRRRRSGQGTLVLLYASHVNSASSPKSTRASKDRHVTDPLEIYTIRKEFFLSC